jgi:hypothetical protein
VVPLKGFFVYTFYVVFFVFVFFELVISLSLHLSLKEVLMAKNNEGVAPAEEEYMATEEQIKKLQQLENMGITTGEAQKYIDAYKYAIERATSTSEIYRVQRLIRSKIRALRMADNMG